MGSLTLNTAGARATLAKVRWSPRLEVSKIAMTKGRQTPLTPKTTKEVLVHKYGILWPLAAAKRLAFWAVAQIDPTTGAKALAPLIPKNQKSWVKAVMAITMIKPWPSFKSGSWMISKIQSPKYWPVMVWKR